MGFVVCSINLNLVMESASRKAPEVSNRALSVPWPFLWRCDYEKFGKKNHKRTA